MKVLTQFDRVIAETLQERVKARLTFKVLNPSMVARGCAGVGGVPMGALASLHGVRSRRSCAQETNRADSRWHIGFSRYVPLLRRSLDVPDPQRDV